MNYQTLCSGGGYKALSYWQWSQTEMFWQMVL
jgi:hypothetical protein